MKNLFAVLLLIHLMAAAFGQQTQSTRIQNVSIDEFTAAMDSLEGEMLIDLRTPEELKNGKIPGARVIDFFGPDFEPAIQALDRDKVYLLYCASGGRSGETAELMESMGFKKIYNMEEGFSGWQKRKLPIEKVHASPKK